MLCHDRHPSSIRETISLIDSSMLNEVQVISVGIAVENDQSHSTSVVSRQVVRDVSEHMWRRMSSLSVAVHGDLCRADP